MAPRLQAPQGKTTDAKVVHLKPRKAAGAGGQKRKGPSTKRLKPAAHAEKPKRQTAVQKAAEAAFRPVDPGPVETSKSAASVPAVAIAPQPTDADIRRDLQDRLVALHHQLKPVEQRITANAEVASQLKSQKQELRGRIQGIIPLAIYDEMRKKLDQKTKRSDNEQYEKLRALAFEAFALPCGPAPELPLDKVPEAAKPALFWEERGYQDAVDGKFSDPVAAGVPPENNGDYSKGFTRGVERNASGIKLLETAPIPPKADVLNPDAALPAASIPGAEKREGVSVAVDSATAGDKSFLHLVTDAGTRSFEILADGQLDWSSFPVELDAWSDDERAIFAAWYETTDPNRDYDITHPGVEHAWDAAVAAEEDAPAAVDSGASELL